MAQKASEYFDEVIAAFRDAFNQVVAERYETSERSVLELTGSHGDYHIRLSEIVIPNVKRRYSYYVLRGKRVIAGFDNSSDPRALRLKYGQNYTRHRLELVPHRHTEDKAELHRTGEMDYTAFIAWVLGNLPE